MTKYWRVFATIWLMLWISVFGCEIYQTMATGSPVPYPKWMSILLCISGCFLVWSTPKYLFKNIDWELGVIVYAPAIYFTLFAATRYYVTPPEGVEIVQTVLAAIIAGLFAAAAAHWVARWTSNWPALQRTSLSNHLSAQALPGEACILGVNIENRNEHPIKGAKVSVFVSYRREDVEQPVPAIGRTAIVLPHNYVTPNFEAVAWAEGDHPRRMDLAANDHSRCNLFEVWGRPLATFLAVNSESSENRGSYRVVLKIRRKTPFTGYIKITSDDTLAVIYPFTLNLQNVQNSTELGSPLVLGNRLAFGEIPQLDVS